MINEVTHLPDEDLIIFNNLLVKEITDLNTKLGTRSDVDGQKSLKDLVIMYKQLQTELEKRELCKS